MKGLLSSLWVFLFVRNIDTDDLSMYPNWRVGLSAAASWSWGVSLGAGIAIMWHYGVLPFFIWTTGNILSLPLFGIVRKSLPESVYWRQFLFPMVMLFLFVEFFCIILNLQGVLIGLSGELKVKGEVIKILSEPLLSGDIATCSIIIGGFAIVWYIYKGGLRISVLTDFAQYAIQLLAVIIMAIMGYFLGHTNDVEWVVINETVNGLAWAKFGFFGIIVGALCTSHQWQRFDAVEEKNILPVALWGGGFFGIYMLFVGLTGYFFTTNSALGRVFLITMIALASSSIDSSIAGLEYVVNAFTNNKLKNHSWLKPYYLAAIIACIAILSWPFFISSGMTGIWDFMAKCRLPIAIFFIVGTYFAHVIISIIKDKKK